MINALAQNFKNILGTVVDTGKVEIVDDGDIHVNGDIKRVYIDVDKSLINNPAVIGNPLLDMATALFESITAHIAERYDVENTSVYILNIDKIDAGDPMFFRVFVCVAICKTE